MIDRSTCAFMKRMVEEVKEIVKIAHGRKFGRGRTWTCRTGC